MANVLFQQVTFEKPIEDGVRKDTVWIEAGVVKEGEYAKRKMDGQWVDGWKVLKIYNGLRTQEEVIAARDRHKDHRKGTDI